MDRWLAAALSVFLLFISGAAGTAGEWHGKNHICFMRIDTNHDDKVTPEELARFYPDNKGLFDKIDQDKDGGISHDEYEAYWYDQAD